MREQLEQKRDVIVRQIVDFDKDAALIAHDGITELIDSVVANMHQMVHVIEPAPIHVATFAQVRKAIAEALNVQIPKEFWTPKPSSRKSTKAPHIARAGQKQRKRVARKSQSRRA